MMKCSLHKIILVLLTVAIAFILAPATVKASDQVDILFTSDLHSYVEGYEKVYDGEGQIDVGGFARLKTYIDQKKEKKPNTLLLDCGDTVMGTLFQTVIDTEATELRFLSQFGYDALTYGNHEFDYGVEVLSNMYETTAKNEQKRPHFVTSNVDWNQTDEYTTRLKKAMEEYGYSDYMIVEKGGVKIAITGCLGIDAIKCAPTCELTFVDYIEGVKATVKKIKETENPDMIVCLSHSGTGNELGDTEDENLAKEVPDLDVIISGHTHTYLPDSIKIGDTHIFSCGEYGQYTGDITLNRNSSGRWDLGNYELVRMDSKIAEDPEVLKRIEEVKETIYESELSDIGVKADDVIAYNDGIEFESVGDTLANHTEMKLCNMMSDAYRYEANLTPTGREIPFDMAVVPSGTVRGSFLDGEVTAADTFEALSLGVGKDGTNGYPLVSLFLTGKEVKTIIEVDASISDLMTTARLYTSGVAFEYNPNRLILNKTVDSWLTPAFLETSREEIEDDKLYRIVTDSYSMSMLGAVTDMSKGILSVIPKDENGNPISDPFDCIIYNEDGSELKAWIALKDYMGSFAENEQGISQIPDYYASTQDRKIVNDSWGPRAMFKNTSKYAVIIVVFVLLLILLLIVIIRAIVKNIHKKKVYK